MAKDTQLFGIIAEDNNWMVLLNENGSFTTGSLIEGARLNIVQLEEWLNIIKAYNIPYKVKAFQIEQV